MVNLERQKTVEIASDPVQRRVMHTVRAQQRLKSVKTLHVPMHYLAKNGNVVVLNQ
jgi:hypothetical protein